MDDFDFYVVAVGTLVLCLATSLIARVVSEHDDKIDALRADVSWLKDNTVAHETEARP
jgi:uncharacterized protein YccT (UPF0319 family)